MKSKQYAVFKSQDGGGDVYLGIASTIEQAKEMAHDHAFGPLIGLPDYEYEQARIARHISGLRPPPWGKMGEPDEWEWFGEGGWYCACPIKCED